jgi:hypothetical protein
MDMLGMYHEVVRRLYFNQETHFRRAPLERAVPVNRQDRESMRFESDRLGYVFSGDYPEFYGPEDLARLRAILPVQIGRLAAADPVADAHVVGVLVGRRCGDQARPQLEQRPRRDGTHSLVARGEVVLPGDEYEAGSVRHLLEGFNHHPGHGKRRPGARVCLRNPAAAPTDVDQVIDGCAAVKVAAWPNYLATMAAVGKGIGGPEPAPTPAPAPDPDPVATQGASGPSAAAPAGPPPATSAEVDPIRIAIIDTGIPEQTRTDGWLAIERTADNVDKLDALPAGPDGLLDYAAGHGAFVTGIVQRVAPRAEVRMYRAADTDGFATDHDIADAILRAHEDGAQIINLSLGIRTVDDTPPPATAEAVATVLGETGNATVIVASAGNYGDDAKVWPAALPGVEAVAGLTAYLTPAPWSSYGDVRFSTVAEGIRSTYVTGVESPVFDPQPDDFGTDAWAIWSGTSFAAPQIAAAIARVAAEEGIAPRDAADRLDEFGKPIAGYGKAVRILEGIG